MELLFNQLVVANDFDSTIRPISLRGDECLYQVGTVLQEEALTLAIKNLRDKQVVISSAIQQLERKLILR